MDLKERINETAEELGMSPLVLGTIISFETAGTFNPRKKGPTTKWGQHEGLIQFGKPQAKTYGADFSSEQAALDSQLGKNGAIVKYFRSNGWRPGMGMMQAYSIVNAGGPNRFDRSDTAAGGTAGTVRDKVQSQMADHRAKAKSLLGGEFSPADFADGGGDDVVFGGEGQDALQATPQQIEGAYKAFIDGEMTPSERAEYEADVRSGRMPIPTGMSLYEAYEAPEYEGDVRTGRMRLPVGASLDSDPVSEALPVAEPTFPVNQIPTVDDGPATPRQPIGQGLDLTRQYAGSSGGDLASAAIGSLAGRLPGGTPQPSPTASMLPEGTPPMVRSAISGFGDAGLAVLGGAGAVVGAGAGLAGDAAQAMGFEQGGKRLAEDLAAIPEAFAGSPTSMATRVPTFGRRVDVPDVPDVADETVAQLMRKASGSGPGSASARQKLADMADVDPEAAAAAERLGIEMPSDVFARDPRTRMAAAKARDVKGGDAQLGLDAAVVKAEKAADDILETIQGDADIAEVSDVVQRSLQATQADLDKQATRLYNKVDTQVQASTPASLENSKALMEEIQTDLGDLKLTGSEAKLQALLSGNEITYAGMNKIRREVGRALFKSQGPYADADTAMLKRVYGALAEDRLETVEAVAGPEMRSTLRRANQITAKKKGLEDRIINAFGKDLEGSIARKLQTAVNNASKGDVANLNRILKAIPKDLRSRTIATAITSVSQGKAVGRLREGTFGFAEFNKTWGGIQKNKPVLALVSKELGPEASQLMRDLHKVSGYITDARGAVSQTGKANQAFTEQLIAEGIVGKILQTNTGRFAASSAAAAAGGAIGGPFAAGIAAAATAGAGGKSSARAMRLSKLFGSDEMQSLLREAATAQPHPATIKRAAESKAFKQWAKANRITNPQRWILSAMTGQTVDDNQNTDEAEQ